MIKNYPILKKIVPLFFLLFSLSAFSQIAQRGTATTATSINASITINKPAGITVGDLMLADIAQGTNKSESTNPLNINPTCSGWTLISSVYLNGKVNRKGTVLYKIAVASDVTATNYTFALDADNDSASGAIIAFSGVDTTTPFDVMPGTINTNDSATVTATSITTVTANTAIVMLGQAVGGNRTWSGWTTTSPGALAELFDVGNGNGKESTVGGAWAIKPTAGATGSGTATLSGKERNGGILLALRPVVITITTGIISPTSYCAGDSVSIPYTISGTYNVGNIFTAQLSNASGGFAAPVNIGTLTSTAAGTISGTIPVGTATGTGYRIRVVSSNPVVTGVDNGDDLTVNAIPSAPTVGTITQPTCATATGSVILSGLPSGSWELTRSPGSISSTGTGTSTTISNLSPGTYTYTVIGTNNGTGLKADYFNNMTLSGTPALTRTDATVNFDWGTGNPGAPIGNDNFSVRWSGQIQPLYSENYTFTTRSDDGIRLWVNGTQIINNWTDHGPTNDTGAITITAGVKYDIVLEFYENGGGAVAQLSWSSASQTNQIIPQSQLYPSAVCSSSTSENVVVNAQPATPTAPTTTGDIVCVNTTATLLASGAIAGDLYKWYNAETAGTVLKTSATDTDNTYVTSAISASTDYWVSIIKGGCESSRTIVTAANYGNNIWTGKVNSDWNTSGNWCSNAVPSVTNNLDVLIPSGLLPTYPYPILSTGASGYVENIVFEPGTTLNVVNNSLRVTNNLTLNGIIDLEGESQLLQDMGSVFDAASTGTIEIDQQGEGNKYRYNYWSMPVYTATEAILGNYTTIAASLRDGTIPSSPGIITFNNSGYDGALTTPITLSTYWMYKYANSGNGYSAWNQVRSTGYVYTGQGFTMKGPGVPGSPQQNYTFVGKPNNGTINLTVAANYDYLVGNPYPSAIDADQFLSDNSSSGTASITGAIYFWEHYGGDTHNLAGYQGGYATYSLGGGVQASAFPGLGGGISVKGAPKQYIPVGQAFFVVGDSDGGQIQFNNGQRVFVKEGLTSIFMKTSNTKSKTVNIHGDDLRPKFRIGFDAPKISHRQLLLTIDEKATQAVDWGYEAEIYEIFADDMYWMLNNKKYVIQATNDVGLGSEVPLGIQLSKTGMVTVKIDSLENVDENIAVYLKDKLTGESFNMKDKPVQLNLVAGKYPDRFAIIFKMQKLVAEDVDAEAFTAATAQPIIEGIHVYMNNAIGELQIKNNSVEEIVSVALINSLGQTVKTWNSNFNIRTISLPISTATGVYLVQINTKTCKAVKKISVE